MKTIFFILSVYTILILSFNRQEMKIEIQAQNESVNMDTVLINDLNNKLQIDSNFSGLNFVAANNYSKTKLEIKQLRTSLAQVYIGMTDSLDKTVFLDSVSNVFSKKLLNDIIPYWYGTIWDFNGYTAKPNHGVIACGYFFSTTLRDMGLILNRYTLAQQGPENEAMTIAIDRNNMLVFNENNLKEELPHLDDGLYFVGLDSHVGYLYKNENELYFIHSNYIDGFVMVENIKSSIAFSSDTYYIVPITNNRSFVKKWITNEEIEIIR